MVYVFYGTPSFHDCDARRRHIAAINLRLASIVGLDIGPSKTASTVRNETSLANLSTDYWVATYYHYT